MTTISTTVQERLPAPVIGPAPPAVSKALTPADILAMLRRRMVLVILLSILFSGIAVGLFFLVFFKFPKYSAEAYVECISNAPRVAMSVEQPQLQDDPFLRFIESQALRIKTFPILSEVLQDAEVRRTGWYKKIKPKDRLLELKKDLGSSPIRNTNYIRVSLATRNPSDPHIIVNKVVDAYLTRIKDSASQPFREELNEYRRELAAVQDQIKTKQQQIRDFASTIQPGNLPSGEGNRNAGGANLARLMDAQQKVGEYELEVAQLESLKKIYADPTGPAITPEDRLATEQDPRVATLDNQVFALEQEMNVLREQLGPNHREFREMQRRKVEAERQLEIARENRLREVVEQKKQQIETAFYNSQSALLTAKTSLQEAEAQQADLEAKLSEYYRLFDERKLLEDIKTRIDGYIREIDRLVHDRSAITVQSAVRASPPLQRSSPRLILLPALVFLAFAGAIGVAIGLELINTTVRTPLDILRHLQLAFLGSIPDVDDEEIHIERVESAVREAPRSMVTEAFRTVRSNLQFSAPPERLRSLLITSPKPEDGRTTVAANLAASLAVGGRRVLLVDANFRRPALQRIYEHLGTRGMTNILIGEATFSDCVQRTDLPNLDVVGSGPIPPNPAELLGGVLMRKFIAEVTQSYDHVLFDSPPVLLASDATVLATMVDGTIMVCRAGSNSRGIVMRATTLLNQAGAHQYGAVLNAAQAQRGGYFREQQRLFYEYQHEDQDQTPPALPKRKSHDGDAIEKEGDDRA